MDATLRDVLSSRTAMVLPALRPGDRLPDPAGAVRGVERAPRALGQQTDVPCDQGRFGVRLWARVACSTTRATITPASSNWSAKRMVKPSAPKRRNRNRIQR